MDDGMRWPGQLKLVGGWRDGAHALGIWCLNRAKALGGANHIRRVTDTQVLTPFDCYHYRIIYQTFHAMRDVLLPLSHSRGTAVLPFQYSRLPRASRVIVEACPSSTLKRLSLPHQNYKQPTGGALTSKRRRTRATILARASRLVRISPQHRRQIMRNPGGDALDAVLAALGAAQGWQATEPRRRRKPPTPSARGVHLRLNRPPLHCPPMAINVTEFPTRGKVIETKGDLVVFQPLGTRYEMHLKPRGGALGGPTGSRVEAVIRIQARKVMTVPSGGNFIAPIFGPPRIVQGRVRSLDEQTMVVQASAFIAVELPAANSALDLNNGPIEVGSLVNVTALPGATIELLAQPAAAKTI
jgi:hypothetical protein